MKGYVSEYDVTLGRYMSKKEFRDSHVSCIDFKESDFYLSLIRLSVEKKRWRSLAFARKVDTLN